MASSKIGTVDQPELAVMLLYEVTEVIFPTAIESCR